MKLYYVRFKRYGAVVIARSDTEAVYLAADAVTGRYGISGNLCDWHIERLGGALSLVAQVVIVGEDSTPRALTSEPEYVRQSREGGL